MEKKLEVSGDVIHDACHLYHNGHCIGFSDPDRLINVMINEIEKLRSSLGLASNLPSILINHSSYYD